MSTGTIAPTEQPKALTPFQKTKGWLQSDDFKAAVGAAMPKHMTPDRFVRIALTAMMKTPKLAQCTQESVFNCLLQLSQYGLEPDGRRAHLIPFDVRKNVGGQWQVDHTDCTLIIDYKGYAELVMRSGLVSSIHADVVCENDDFEYDRGFITRHKIDFRKPRGAAYAAYAVIRFKDGTEKCEVMPAEDIYAIRDRGQGWQSFKKGYTKQSPWNPAEPVIEREMWKKTVFRRITKWVPLSAEIRDALANEEDEEVRLIDVSDRIKEIDTTGKSKSDSLAEVLAARLEAQQRDEGQQDEPQNNGEDSQNASPDRETPSPSGPGSEGPPLDVESEVAKRISADIAIASDMERFMALEGAIGLIVDDDLRVRLYGEVKARQEQLGMRMGGKAKKGALT